MAYLIAAIEMTLSVVEGHSFVESFFQVGFFRIFVARRAVALPLQSFLSNATVGIQLCSN